MRRTIWVITGPSGVGKTTLANGLTEAKRAYRIKTNTTRRRRLSEADEYRFMDEFHYEGDAAHNNAMAHTEHCGHHYWIDSMAINMFARSRKKNAVVVLDNTGANCFRSQLREKGVGVDECDVSVIALLPRHLRLLDLSDRDNVAERMEQAIDACESFRIANWVFVREANTTPAALIRWGKQTLNQNPHATCGKYTQNTLCVLYDELRLQALSFSLKGTWE